VLAGLEGGDGQPAVIGHAGQYQHGIDVVSGDQVGVACQVGVGSRQFGDRPPLGRVWVEGGPQLYPALRGQPVDQSPVGGEEHAAQAENPQPHGHAGPRAVDS